MPKQINLRVNEELNAQIEAKCDQLSLKKAQFIRLAILNALKQPQLPQLLEIPWQDSSSPYHPR